MIKTFGINKLGYVLSIIDNNWTPRALDTKLLYWGKTSEIAGGHMPNKKTGATDFLLVSGIAGSETYQCPNTAPYIAADTDYIWFKTNNLQRIVTTLELTGYDLLKTPVKFDDNSPNVIREIIILSVPFSTLNIYEKNKLFQYMHLPIEWNNDTNIFGHIKDNRMGQHLWIPEAVGDPDMVIYATGLTTPLSSGQYNLIQNFIVNLKTALAITHLSDCFDVMYFLANETEESALRNLVRRAHDATKSGSLTFTALEGYNGGGTSYLNTNYNPTANGVNISQNNISIGAYSRTDNASSTTVDFGGSNASNLVRTYLLLKSTTGIRVSTNTGGAWDSLLSSLGMFIATRTGSTTSYGYRNKNKSTNFASASVGLTNSNLYICARNNGGTADAHSSRQIAFAFVSKGLSDAEVASITDIFEVYMDTNIKGVI